MKLRHIIRDSMISIRQKYYKHILRKPRIYFLKEDSHLKQYGINHEEDYLRLFYNNRKFNVDMIASLKERIKKVISLTRKS